MRLQALVRLVGAVRALVPVDRVVVMGSASLLARDPALGEPGGPLEPTADADLLVEPINDELAALVHEAIGRGSLYDQAYGCHVDLLRAAIASQLAPGWEARLVAVPGADAFALSAVDVCAVKVRVGRPKDLDVVRHLLCSGLVDGSVLVATTQCMALQDRELPQLFANLRAVGALT